MVRAAIVVVSVLLALGVAGDASAQARKGKTPAGVEYEVPCKPGTYESTERLWECEMDTYFAYPAITPKGRKVEVRCFYKARFYPSGQLAYCRQSFFVVDGKPGRYDLALKTSEADEDVRCSKETVFFPDGSLFQCTVDRARLLLRPGSTPTTVNCHGHNVIFTHEGHALGCDIHY
jgi:hypothetical protein